MQLPTSLKEALSSKNILPLVGAGVSMSIKNKKGEQVFPSWKLLLENAATKIKGENDTLNSGLIELFLKGGDYQEAAKYAHKGLEKGLWHNFIEEQFDIDLTSLDEKSADLPKAIWGLSNKIITLNYDRILPWAFSKGAAQVAILKNDAIANLPKMFDGNDKPMVWHLHGHIDDTAKLILTPNSYEKLYSTSNETGDEYKAALQVFKNVISTKSLLFIGCSLEDAELLVEINKQNYLFAGSCKTHFALIKESDKSAIAEKLQGTTIQIVTFEDYGQPLVDAINKMVGCINTTEVSLEKTDKEKTPTTESKAELKIVFLSASPIGSDIDYQPIFKELKKLNYSINCLSLTEHNLQNLHDYEYVFIASNVIKERLVIEDDDACFDKIDFIDLQHNADLSDKKGVFIFTNSSVSQEKLDGITFPLLVLDVLGSNNSKKSLTKFVFQVFKKQNIEYYQNLGLIFNIDSFSFPQININPLKLTNNVIKNETKLPRIIDRSVLNNFVGRNEDLVFLSREITKLESDNGFITIKGSGGLGKTTISKILAIIFSERGRFSEGIEFIDCEHLLNIDQFKFQIASVFNLEKAQYLEEHLSNHFDGGSRFIILDNFETLLHLDDKVKILELLSFMSEFASIVVTSREFLKVDGEIPYTLRQMTSDEAFELFTKRLGNRKLSKEESKLVNEEIIDKLLDKNPLAIIIITSNILPNKDLSELNKELREDFFSISEEDLSLFDNASDINIDRKKSLYGSILYSYNMLLENEKEAFEKLALFPDGVNIENFKKLNQQFKNKDLKKAVISDKILKKLQNKSLIEESGNRIKLQSIIGRFAEEKFKKRENQTVFFDSVFKFNDAIAAFLLDLTLDKSIKKQTLALEIFEENQNNFLKAISYIGLCSQKNEIKVYFIDHVSSLFLAICSLSNFINILSDNKSIFSGIYLSTVECIIEKSRYFDGHFHSAYQNIQEMISLNSLQHLDRECSMKRIQFLQAFSIYSMEGNQAYLYSILNASSDRERKTVEGIDIGIFDVEVSGNNGLTYFEFLYVTNNLELKEIDEYLRLIHKKDHLDLIQISFIRSKLMPYDKEYINQLVVVNPYTYGLKSLMLAFCESDLVEAKKCYQRAVENLEHIKYYYVEGFYWYAVFLKKHNMEEYNNIYLDGYNLAKKYHYRYLHYLFDELEEPSGLIYNCKHYPLPDFKSLGITEANMM